MTANCANSQEQPTAVFYAQFHTEKCDKEAQLKEQSANHKPDRSHMGQWFICNSHGVKCLHKPKNKTLNRKIQRSSHRRWIT